MANTVAALSAIGAIEQNCIRSATDRAFTQSILAALSESQQDALLRLVRWINQAKRSPAEIHDECERTLAGDLRFTEAVGLAIESTRLRPRQVGANDSVLTLADRFQL
jgi:hypothetical protein